MTRISRPLPFLLSLGLSLALGAAGCKKKPAAEAQGSAAGSDSAATTATPTPVPEIKPEAKPATPEEAVAAADRTAEDKALDAGRKPAELLTFLKVGPGMKAAELFAGGGYSVELLARVVGKDGVVYGQNIKQMLEMFAEKPWSERLTRLNLPNIRRVDRELDAPLPPEVNDLDLVMMHLVYHDAVWLGVDRAAMNKAIWSALKPGGEFAIIDHSAKDGTGDKDAKSLHRIEPKFVQAEVEKAGFVLDRSSELFKHAEDTRDWSTSPRTAADKRGTSDRFTLVFKKPADAGAPAAPAK
jgi:predicted methyltransferase